VGGGQALPAPHCARHAQDKSRTEVAGPAKIVEAEGTGRARIGSVRSPSGVTANVHGPQPRSYEYAFPRKKLLGALRSALAAKLADGKLTVVDTLESRTLRPSSTARR